jgi:hypothetical protein
VSSSTCAAATASTTLVFLHFNVMPHTNVIAYDLKIVGPVLAV